MTQETSSSTVFWKKEITLGQIVGIIITLFGVFATAWWDINVRVNEHSMRITAIEKNQEGFITLYKEGQAKQDIQNTKTNEKLEQILINLQNKKDRD